MCSTVQSWDAAWQLDALQRKGAVAGGEDSRLTASGLDGPWLSYAEETELLESHHVVNLLPFVATRYGPASRALPLLSLSDPRLTLRGAGLLVYGGVASGPQGSLMVRSDCLGYERELKPVPQTEIRTACGLPQPVRLRKSLSLNIYTHTLGNTIYPQ